MRKLDPPCPLGEIASHLDVSVDPQQAGLPIERIAPLSVAGERDMSFLADSRYAAQVGESDAGAILINEQHAALVKASAIALVVPDPYMAFARATGLFRARLDAGASAQRKPAVHPTAFVDSDATLGEDVDLGAHVVVQAGASIGAHCRIGAGTVVGERTQVGARTVIGANVSLYSDCLIGASCTIEAGTVVGSDGFGYARDGERWQKISQLGTVQIGDRVQIGSNCSIDRGALEDTVIEDDCILDNLIQVAHNVRIGAGSALAGCVGIAGSATLGRGCMIGGGAGILGHLKLVDGVIVSPMSLVTRSINKPGFYSGTFPLMENAQWEKAAAALRRLPDLRSRLRQLEKLTREFNP